MKTIIKRIALIFLSLILTLLCSCNSDINVSKNTVIYATDDSGKAIPETVMTEGMFNYFLSTEKQIYLANISFDESINGDSAELWQKIAPDGKTYEEKLYSMAVEEAKRLVAANKLLYTLPSDDNYALPEEAVNSLFSEVEARIISNYGSVISFENILNNIGCTYDEYKKLYLMQYVSDYILKEFLFNNPNGSLASTEEYKQKYYAENYFTLEHIVVQTVSDEKLDGTVAPLSQAETEKRKAVAQEIFEFMKNGGTRDAAAQKYTQSYVTIPSSQSAVDSKSLSTAMMIFGEDLEEMEIGEVRLVESQYGTHIIQLFETIPEDYNKNQTTYEALTSTVNDIVYEELVASQIETLIVNEKIIDAHTMAETVVPQ